MDVIDQASQSVLKKALSEDRGEGSSKQVAPPESFLDESDSQEVTFSSNLAKGASPMEWRERRERLKNRTKTGFDGQFLYTPRDTKEKTKPRLLKKNGDFCTRLEDFQNDPWYKNLTDEQKKSFDRFVTIDSDKVDTSSNKNYYTIKEILRKIGANLNTVVGDPATFGERETVLAGGYPTSERSLSHIIEAYNKNHNLKVYDLYENILPAYKGKLEQEEILSDIDFNLGKPLGALGQVHNHDIIIPHPGPDWISDGLARELNTVLGPGSKAYILTDTAVSQKDQLAGTLQNYKSLRVREECIGYVQTGSKIILGGVSIEPTYAGPYYVLEISQE